MRAGLGISLVNGNHEELIYARFEGIVLSAKRLEDTYLMTGSVDKLQIDNQLLYSDRWQVLYCQPEVMGLDEEGSGTYINGDLPPGVSCLLHFLVRSVDQLSRGVRHFFTLFHVSLIH
ncbi:unnamed protein product [Cylicostephanus goldi]|uniref:Uncharacterized protein n=1 Tax=Cylicostephanus goldi TaxID=71465 RepID=A0A3P6SU94_CYLGO|nr:unnamed protein product [Cylicostephanus goldi]